jgi:hypothetical protein
LTAASSECGQHAEFVGQRYAVGFMAKAGANFFDAMSALATGLSARRPILPFDGAKKGVSIMLRDKRETDLIPHPRSSSRDDGIGIKFAR